MAMIAMAFGKFASKLIGIEENLELWDQVFASGLILVLVFLTLAGSTLIRKVQKVFVMTNLVILAGYDPPARQPGADVFCLYRFRRDQQRGRANGQTRTRPAARCCW